MFKKLIAVVVVAVLAAFVWVALGRGVRVTVENVGSTPITDVVVEVTGNEHAIGDVAPGGAETVRVSPTGESHVQVTWKDANGRASYGRVDCYFEASGYNGTVLVKIDGVSVKGTEEDIDVGFF